MNNHHAPWTEAEDAKLRAFWTDRTLPTEVIAERLGRSVSTLRERAKVRLGLGSRRGLADSKNAFWTPERVKVLTEGVAKGIPFSELGKRLGCTRNAGIGKAMRLGITQPKASAPKRMTQTSAATEAAARARAAIRAAKPTSPPKPRPKPRAVVCGSNTVVDHVQRPALVAPPKADAWAALEGSKPRPFETRRWTECNWPIDDADGAPMLRCCLPVERGGYCSTHRVIARAPRQPRDAKPGQLARSLRRYA